MSFLIMGKILIAPNHEEINGPLIFLAGPTEGVHDWQSEAIGFFQINPNISVASPRRGIEKQSDIGGKKYREQFEWERLYLEYAARHGVVMFWLPKSAENIEQSSYAHTFLFELGEFVTRYSSEKFRIVVGIEKEFPEERFIREMLAFKIPDVPISNNLNDTCGRVLEMAIGLR